LFFTTAMLPNGKVFAVGGEYPSFSNTAEIFDPLANGGLGSWTYVDSVPTADSQYGDDPIEVVATGPNAGQILAGYYNSGTTGRQGHHFGDHRYVGFERNGAWPLASWR
jgi:hypothetical protein